MATALQRPRSEILSWTLRRTSSRVIWEERSKSKPQSVCGGPRSATFVLGWLSRRTLHHQKSALSFDELWRKALKFLTSNAPNLSVRISVGVAISSTVFGKCWICARGAMALTAACAAKEAGTRPLDKRSDANISVNTTTCVASAGRCGTSTWWTTSSLSKPCGIATTGKLSLLAFTSSVARPARRDESSSSTARPGAWRRATCKAGRMEPRPKMTINAPGGTQAIASL
mmetsp:Transcript_23894/g.67688  ORF Transcript_23894/g.67688 Transcript_23894/m.67688 type:complete len:229 (+) Transcript_23894:2227-2913(+)